MSTEVKVSDMSIFPKLPLELKLKVLDNLTAVDIYNVFRAGFDIEDFCKERWSVRPYSYFLKFPKMSSLSEMFEVPKECIFGWWRAGTDAALSEIGETGTLERLTIQLKGSSLSMALVELKLHGISFFGNQFLPNLKSLSLDFLASHRCGDSPVMSSVVSPCLSSISITFHSPDLSVSDVNFGGNLLAANISFELTNNPSVTERCADKTVLFDTWDLEWISTVKELYLFDSVEILNNLFVKENQLTSLSIKDTRRGLHALQLEGRSFCSLEMLDIILIMKEEEECYALPRHIYLPRLRRLSVSSQTKIHRFSLYELPMIHIRDDHWYLSSLEHLVLERIRFIGFCNKTGTKNIHKERIHNLRRMRLIGVHNIHPDFRWRGTTYCNQLVLKTIEAPSLKHLEVQLPDSAENNLMILNPFSRSFDNVHERDLIITNNQGDKITPKLLK